MAITTLVALVAVLAVALVAESLLDSSVAAWTVIGVWLVIWGSVAVLGVWASKRRRDDRK